MADFEEQDENLPLDDEAFEEALDAAEVFHELDEEEAALIGDESVEEEVFADEFKLGVKAGVAEVAAELIEEIPAQKPEPLHQPAGTGASIGELFRPVVRHCPPSKIRIEADSIGALFRGFIEQG